MKVEIEDIGQVDCSWWKLKESLNSHSVFLARILHAPRSPELGLLGRKCTFRLKTGGALQFKGVIWRSKQESDSSAQIKVFSFSKLRAGTKKIRSYGDWSSVKPIHELLAGSSVIENVNGAKQLNLVTGQVFQYEESDWALLCRLASRNGLGVVTSRVNGSVDLISCAGTDRQMLSAKNIMEEHIQIDAQLVVGKTEGRMVDVEEAVASNTPLTSKLPNNEMLKFICRKAELIFNKMANQLVYFNTGQQANTLRLTDIQSQRINAQAFRVHLNLKNANICVGQRISLPQSLGIECGDLVVIESTMFDDLSDSTPLENSITCVLADVGYPQQKRLRRKRPHSSSRSRVIPGQVVDVADPKRMGRVKVNFAWQNWNSEATKESEGIWCHCPQPFAGGTNVEAKCGILVVPHTGNWVMTYFPDNGDMPTILGAVYHKLAPIPINGNDPSKEITLIKTEAGLRMSCSDSHAFSIEVTSGESGPTSEITVSAAGNRIDISTEHLGIVSEANVEGSWNVE